MKSFSKGKVKNRAFGITLYAEPGWGKTTLGAQATEANMIMTGQETGYLTLLNRGLVPDIPRAHARSWAEFQGMCKELLKADDPGKVLVIDSLSELEGLVQEYILNRDFNGSQKAFEGWKQGYGISSNELKKAIKDFDRLKAKGVSVLLLAHSGMKTIKNKVTGDTDKMTLNIYKNSIDQINQWSDAVMYGFFEADITEDEETGKVTTDKKERVLSCGWSAAHEAKNRLGIPERIEMPGEPNKMWKTFREAILNSKGE